MDGGWYSNNFHIYIGLAILGRLKIRFPIILWVFRKMNILGGGGMKKLCIFLMVIKMLNYYGVI